MKRIAVLLLAVLLATPAGAAIVVTVSTDKSTYNLGELINISITAHNTSAQPVKLVFASDHQSSYCIDGLYDWEKEHSVHLTVITYQLVPANSTYTWTMIHGDAYSLGYPLGTGAHTVIGEVLGGGKSEAIAFNVIPEPASLLLLALGGLSLRSVSRHRPE